MINIILTPIKYIPLSKTTRGKTRMFIHNVMIGAGALAMLTIGLHETPPEPPRLTKLEIVDALAAVLDGDDLQAPVIVSNPQIPSRKPERGYSNEFRNEMNALIAKVMK